VANTSLYLFGKSLILFFADFAEVIDSLNQFLVNRLRNCLSHADHV